MPSLYVGSQRRARAAIESLSTLLVLEVHVAAFEAAGEEDAVGAFDEVGEAVAGAFDDGVVAGAGVADPGVVAGSQRRSRPQMTPT